jgi:hypothetical protein
MQRTDVEVNIVYYLLRTEIAILWLRRMLYDKFSVHFVGKRTYQLSAQYLPVEKYTPVAGR